MSAVFAGLIGGAIAYALEPLMKRFPRAAWVAIATIGLLVASAILIQLADL